MNRSEDLRFGYLVFEEIHDFQKFIENYWKDNHLFSKETTVFDWQLKGADAYHCLTVRKGDKLVGVQCVIPLCHFDNNLEQSEIFLSLFRAVESEGVAIGLRLFKHVLATYSPKFVGTIGLIERMIPFHKRLNFVVVDMDHHVLLSPYRKKFTIAVVPSDSKIIHYPKTSNLQLRRLDRKDLVSITNDELYSYQTPTKSSTYIISRYLDLF